MITDFVENIMIPLQLIAVTIIILYEILPPLM